MAGLLHSNGVVMGRKDDFFPPPMKENPKGFFENKRFRKINDAILSLSGYSVKSWDPTIPAVRPVNPILKKEMADLVKGYEQEFEWWGWKDPRTMLTLPVWHDVINKLGIANKILIIKLARSSVDISKSMLNRGNKEKFKRQFIEVADEYERRFSIFYDGICNTVPCITIKFKDLIMHPYLVAADLSVFTGKELWDVDFIDKTIPNNIG